jgi:deazaflavin-dependent oxidoreductase (nitroreductase family)
VAFNDDLIADVRANGHATKGPFVGRDLLVLTTKGAKTGQERAVPVVYSEDGGDLVVVASMGGAPKSPAWFHNLRTNPEVTVETGKQRWKAKAVVTPEAERVRLYEQHAAKHPGFRDYVKKTTRKIPVIRLKRLNG